MSINLERLFEPEIIERGRYYHKAGLVKEYSENTNSVNAVVEGTHNYEVYAKFDERGSIKFLECDCPYAESGFNCKHMAAVLFEYSKRHKNRSKALPKRQIDLDGIKQEIKYLRRRYLGREGFIGYWQARNFAAEVLSYLDNEAHALIAQAQYQEAFDLANFIFTTVCSTPMDDDGEASETADSVSSVWVEIYDKCDKTTRAGMFKWLLDTASQATYEILPCTAEEFLFGNFDTEGELKQKLTYCDKAIKKYLNRGNNYIFNRWVIYRAHIMMQLHYSIDDIEEYYKQWQDDEYMQLDYIDWLIARKEYDKAIKITQEEITGHQDHLGHLHDCRKRLKRIYQLQGDTELQKKVLLEMIREGSHSDEELYTELKGLYSREEWDKIKAGVIANMSNRYDKCRYYDLENMADELLKILERSNDLRYFQKYALKVSKKSPEKVVKTYSRVLDREAESAFGGRPHYRTLTWHLRQLGKIKGGDIVAQNLADDWRTKYPARRAMLDELNKAGL